MAADASWTVDPGAVLLIGVLTVAYVPRWRRVRRQYGAKAAPVSRLLAFAAGVLALAAALISPIDRLGEQAFVMHMVQHILLLDLAPILLIVSLTKVMLRPATRRLQRLERAAGPLAHPVVAVALYVAVMWGWHVPALYDAALEHSALHAFEHTCFMAVGFLYWWHLLAPIRSRMRLGGMGPVVYMLSTKVLVGLLGIALTFAPDALYAFYEDRPQIWGLEPGEDQALAGAVMALEQSIVMGVALAWLFINALIESERQEQRADREEERAERARAAARAEEGPRAMPRAGDGGQPIVSTSPDGRNG